MIFIKRKRLALPEKEELHSRMQLKNKDEQLLRMLFASHIPSDEKVAFFKDLDIEKEPMEFNLMLAHLCYRHGNQDIPPLSSRAFAALLASTCLKMQCCFPLSETSYRCLTGPTSPYSSSKALPSRPF